MVVLGDMSVGRSMTPVENIAECLQVAFDAGPVDGVIEALSIE